MKNERRGSIGWSLGFAGIASGLSLALLSLSGVCPGPFNDGITPPLTSEQVVSIEVGHGERTEPVDHLDYQPPVDGRSLASHAEGVLGYQPPVDGRAHASHAEGVLGYQPPEDGDSFA